VISSKNAAGYTDFLKHLNENSYYFTFYSALFEASMQGTETEKSVIDALDRISEHLELFDAVVIIRGGGSLTDLSWFDNYRIAYHITQFPLPVLTGIGHDKDTTVTDMVAYQSLKTPTAAADFLVNSVSETENYLNEMSNSIIELSLSIVNENKDSLDSCRMKLIPLATLKIAEEKKIQASRIIAIVSSGKDFLFQEKIGPENFKSRLLSAANFSSGEQKKRIVHYSSDLKSSSSEYLKHSAITLETLNNNLVILNPENVLKRGYTMTSLKGHIVKNAGLLKEGDIIDTQFSDGVVESTVTNKK
jgi:exodeoxyribonuclease VII large subunit